MIEIKNVFYRYLVGNWLFQDLNLQFLQGKVYGLLGKNGAGKTTLLKLISGLLFPTQGELFVNGYAPLQRQPVFLQDLYYVPEEFYIPELTVEQYCKLYSPFYPDFDQKVCTKLVRAFELPISQKLTTFSYGMKKKFLVAFGLATNCRIFILDEPTNGLDIPSKSQFRRIMASMITKEKIFIIATHQVRDIEKLIDAVAVLDEGKLIFNHSLESITNKLQFKRVSDLASPGHYIYSERILGGYMTVAECQQNVTTETDIDLEVLFNAIVRNKDQLSMVFEGEQTDV